MINILSLLRSVAGNRIPGQVVVQITDRCNAICPQCGMRRTESFERTTLDTDLIKRTIDAAASQDVTAISFTGGEPLMEFRRLADLMRYAGKAGIPLIRTGTNGYMFAGSGKTGFEDRIKKMADQLADTPLRNFWISLDSGVDEIHERMRGFPGVVAGIAKAVPIFHRAGIYPAANLGINRNVGGDATAALHRSDFNSDDRYLKVFYRRYAAAFKNFYRRAVDLGFTMANTCYPMSIDTESHSEDLSAVYAATAEEDVVRFAADEKRMLFGALASAIRGFRSRLRIFSPIASIEALVRQYGGYGQEDLPYGCRGGIDFLFVSAADGHTYPCGYRGHDDFGRLWEMDIRNLRPLPEKKACRQCDWECFRDPSELFGPVLELFSDPLHLIRRTMDHPGSMATWIEDIRYYAACDLFDGRKPPNFWKLARFSRPTHTAYPLAVPSVQT